MQLINSTPTYFEALSIADSLAKTFATTFPSAEQDPNLRSYQRWYCVPGIRWLWRSGDADARTTIAARVAVWRNRQSSEIRNLQSRILARELNRSKGGTK